MQYLKEKPRRIQRDFSLDVQSAQADQTVKQPVKGLTAAHHRMRVDALEHLGAGVEQRPRIPGTEVVMFWLSPLMQHVRHLRRRDRPTVYRLDHEVVSLGMGDTTIPLPSDAFVDLEEPVPETGEAHVAGRGLAARGGDLEDQPHRARVGGTLGEGAHRFREALDLGAALDEFLGRGADRAGSRHRWAGARFLETADCG